MNARVARAAVLTLVALYAAACRSEAGVAPTAEPPPVRVGIVVVEPRTLVEELELVGQLEAEESVWLRSEIDGVIERVAFVEGEEVEAGAVLFTLRDAEQRARLRQARASLELARQVDSRIEELALHDVAAVARRDEVVAELEAAEAAVQIAAVALDRTTIEAPFTGTIGERVVSPGDRIEADDPLAELHALDRLVLRFTVPEAAMLVAEPGRSVELRVAPYPQQSFPAEIFFVSPSVDPATRRMLVKAYVPNADRRLRPGLFANVRLEVRRTENALGAPEDAIAYDPRGSFVWRVGDGNRVKRVDVDLGLRNEGIVEVRGGLRAGDRIVVGGTHKVYPGARVAAAESAESLGGA